MPKRIVLTACCAVLALLPVSARADVSLPKILGSHMVLQRDRPLPVWGWADPGEAVTVHIDAQRQKATADKDGNWKVTLSPMTADGKAHTLRIKGKNEIELSDVLIGEVWLGSGQSNMEWPMARTEHSKQAIAAASHPEIRLFHVPKVQTKTPAKDVKAEWRVCTPATVPQFSAVLYYFGLKLHQELGVPVGLINSSWGGSPIEPWTVARGTSGGMHNGMIAPLQPYAIRGIIWYQGESNVLQKNGLKYLDKMRDLIAGWRSVWGENMPFYFVQIAPWSRYPKDELPPLWEAQVAALKIPHTGMAVTTDIVPDLKDIHPINKKDVGDRLARWALAKDYGRKDVVYSGPLYKSMKVEGARIRLHFAHADRGLKARDGKPLNEFEIAGADGRFVRAQATIDGNSVVVSAPGVAEPTQARFGWHMTANPNLVNAAGLPASPFQTRDWHGGTGE